MKHGKEKYHPKTWNCYFCRKKTMQQSNLYTHLRSHTKEKPWKCRQCPEAFLFQNRLKLHLVTKHPTSEQIQNALKCGLCKDSSVYLHPNQLAQHIKLVHDLRTHKCSYCYKTFPTRAKLEGHYRTHTKENQFSCYFCGSNFLSPRGHMLHLLNRHLNERPEKCDKCSFRTHEILILNTHKRSNHPETDKHAGHRECKICKLWFRKSYLHHHVQSVHGGVKLNRYICYFCGYKCNENFLYEQHIRTHTLERHIRCHKCSFRAYQKAQINTHVRDFHEKVTRYVCPHCSQGFVFTKGLTHHLQSVHKQATVPKLIGRKCATSNQRCHMQKQDEIQKCYFCSKSFSGKKWDLEKHLIAHHTREKPYMCRVCNYSSKNSTMLSEHNRFLHN